MEDEVNDKEMEADFDRYIKSFIENRDPRSDLEINSLKRLKGAYLEKAKDIILSRLEKNPDRDAISSAIAVNFTECVPLLKKWLNENNYAKAEIAYALLEIINDASYISYVIEHVKNEGYGDYKNGIYMLSKFPPTMEALSVVWEKYKKGKRIKYPYMWRESCAYFFRKKINTPVGEIFLSGLDSNEREEFSQLISESYKPSLKYRELNGRLRNETEITKLGKTSIRGLFIKQVMDVYEDYIQSLSWSKNGEFLMSVPNRYSSKEKIKIWRMESDKEFRIIKRKSEEEYSRYKPLCAAWSNDDAEIFEAYVHTLYYKDTMGIVLWDIQSDKIKIHILSSDKERAFRNLLYSNIRELLIFDYNNKIQIMSLTTKETEEILPNFKGGIESFALSSDNKFLAIGCFDLIDPETGIEYKNGDPRRYRTPSEIIVYDIENQNVYNRFDTGHIRFLFGPSLSRLCWMSNKPILAVASADNTISIWDVNKNQQVALLEGHIGRVMDLDFSYDGKLLASTSNEDKTLRIWRTDTWQTIAKTKEVSGHGHQLAFHPTKPILASAYNYAKCIRIWEIDYDEFFTNTPIVEEETL